MIRARATWSERLLSATLIIAISVVVMIGGDLDPLYAGLVGAITLGVINVAYWWMRGVPIREVYG